MCCCPAPPRRPSPVRRRWSDSAPSLSDTTGVTHEFFLGPVSLCLSAPGLGILLPAAAPGAQRRAGGVQPGVRPVGGLAGRRNPAGLLRLQLGGGPDSRPGSPKAWSAGSGGGLQPGGPGIFQVCGLCHREHRRPAARGPAGSLGGHAPGHQLLYLSGHQLLCGRRPGGYRPHPQSPAFLPLHGLLCPRKLGAHPALERPGGGPRPPWPCAPGGCRPLLPWHPAVHPGPCQKGPAGRPSGLGLWSGDLCPRPDHACPCIVCRGNSFFLSALL